MGTNTSEENMASISTAELLHSATTKTTVHISYIHDEKLSLPIPKQNQDIRQHQFGMKIIFYLPPTKGFDSGNILYVNIYLIV